MIIALPLATQQLNFEVRYFLNLPSQHEVWYSDSLQSWNHRQKFKGTFDSFMGQYGNVVMIPIDPLTAVQLGWITPKELLGEMPYLTDSVKAAIRLVI